MQQPATNATGTQLQLVSSVRLTCPSLAWPTVSAALIPSVVHPGSEQPDYLVLPAQRPCLLATHNILVQKITALLMLADHSLYYNTCRGQAAQTVRLHNMYII